MKKLLKVNFSEVFLLEIVSILNIQILYKLINLFLLKDLKSRWENKLNL